MATSVAVKNATTRPDRPFRPQDPAAWRLVVRRLRHRRHHAADRRRGTLRGPRPPGRPEGARCRRRQRQRHACRARRWCEVISTDYVPSLLERGRARAAADGLSVQFKEADAEALDLRRRDFRRRASRPSASCSRRTRTGGCRTAAGMQERRQDRPRQLDAGRLYRAVVQDARQIPAAAGRCEIAGAVGNAGAHHGDVRTRRPLRSRPSSVDFTFRYRSPMHFLDVFRNYYGPTLKAFAALDAANQRRLAETICWR